MMADSDQAWSEWFDAQYPLNEQISNAVAGLSVGKKDAFRAALWASVIENAAEQFRFYLHLEDAPDPDTGDADGD